MKKMIEMIEMIPILITLVMITMKKIGLIMIIIIKTEITPQIQILIQILNKIILQKILPFLLHLQHRYRQYQLSHQILLIMILYNHLPL